MQKEPISERIHIGFYGRCNSGKSSLINALTGQSVSIVSEQAGTTTDVVSKSMELPGIGAVVLLDTPGMDDNTTLGVHRTQAAVKALDRTDIAVLLFGESDDVDVEMELVAEFERRDIVCIPVLAGCDRVVNVVERKKVIQEKTGRDVIPVSSVTAEGLEALRKAIATYAAKEERLLTSGLCESGDLVLLVMPQDSQAPKGRLIQPQVQVIRELLDRGCTPLCCTLETMAAALKQLSDAPALIITDSQVFNSVWKMKPEQSALTSFSILFARYKGDISEFIRGAEVLESLTENSRVLIAEACTHVPQHEDIGRIKLPALLRRKVGEGLEIDIVGGADFPESLETYDLVIHCGACMFTRHHVMSRVAKAREAGIPITNYGTALAALTGILDKVVY